MSFFLLVLLACICVVKGTSVNLLGTASPSFHSIYLHCKASSEKYDSSGLQKFVFYHNLQNIINHLYSDFKVKPLTWFAKDTEFDRGEIRKEPFYWHPPKSVFFHLISSTNLLLKKDIAFSNVPVLLIHEKNHVIKTKKRFIKRHLKEFAGDYAIFPKSSDGFKGEIILTKRIKPFISPYWAFKYNQQLAISRTFRYNYNKGSWAQLPPKIKVYKRNFYLKAYGSWVKSDHKLTLAAYMACFFPNMKLIQEPSRFKSCSGTATYRCMVPMQPYFEPTKLELPATALMELIPDCENYGPSNVADYPRPTCFGTLPGIVFLPSSAEDTLTSLVPIYTDLEIL